MAYGNNNYQRGGWDNNSGGGNCNGGGGGRQWGNKMQKLGAKGGSALVVPAGQWQKKDGSTNKGYTRVQFADAGKVYIIKVYDTTYVPQTGQHANRECRKYSVTCFRG